MNCGIRLPSDVAPSTTSSTVLTTGTAEESKDAGECDRESGKWSEAFCAELERERWGGGVGGRRIRERDIGRRKGRRV